MKRSLMILAVAGLLLTLIAACDENGLSPLPEAMPEDFGLIYQFTNGSVAPPYDYGYQINASVGGQDLIVFRADDMDLVEHFVVPASELSDLYDSALEQGIFKNNWAIEEDPMSGAPYRAALLYADRRNFELPGNAEQRDLLGAFYAEVDSLVPASIWSGLWAARDSMLAARPPR